MTACATNQQQVDHSDERLKERMAKIKHKIFVLSGKGGVGKSTVSVNLAATLAAEGKVTGLLDVDIHGPSIPTMLGLYQTPIIQNTDSIEPVYLKNLRVMSIGFLQPNPDEAFIWRGPMKMGVIKQFLADVEWGELDYLIVDCPPGTGDEPLSICQLVDDPDGAIIVTTPQRVAAVDVRKSVSFCKKLNLPVLGILENMSGFACPKCNEITHIFNEGGGQRIAKDFEVPFLGSLPIDPAIGLACDGGMPFIMQYEKSPTAARLKEIIQPFLSL